MSQLDKYEEMLPDYVAGRLTDDQRRELEQQLENSAELRRALEATRMMAVGLAVIDTVIGGHVESETLVRYCDDPNSLDASRRREVESHLDGCEECRQEMHLCQGDPEETVERAGLFSTLVEWLFAPRLSLRPVYAVVAAGLLLVVIGYYGFGTRGRIPARADFRLTPVSRDLRSTNDLVFDSRTRVVKLEFALPSRPGCSYDFELVDSTGLVIFVRPNHSPQDLQSIEIPTSYLVDGRYRLRVLEISTDQAPVEIANFEFKVLIDRK